MSVSVKASSFSLLVLRLAEYAGVRCASADGRGASAPADYGFPLCANSEEKALYIDEQFRSLIYQCYGIKVKEEE